MPVANPTASTPALSSPTNPAVTAGSAAAQANPTPAQSPAQAQSQADQTQAPVQAQSPVSVQAQIQVQTDAAAGSSAPDAVSLARDPVGGPTMPTGTAKAGTAGKAVGKPIAATVPGTDTSAALIATMQAMPAVAAPAASSAGSTAAHAARPDGSDIVAIAASSAQAAPGQPAAAPPATTPSAGTPSSDPNAALAAANEGTSGGDPQGGNPPPRDRTAETGLQGIAAVSAAPLSGPDAATGARAAASHPPTVTAAMEQVAVRVSRAMVEGARSVTVEMRPEALGRVEVKLDFRADNSVGVQMTLDQKDTYEAFRDNRAALEQQLAQAGVQLGGNLDLRFGDGGQQNAGDQGTANPGQRVVAAMTTAPESQDAVIPAARSQGNSLIDIDA